ncbi:MAG: glycosyltransferase [Firmicutes bacterium]|jgi:glycosyltransferase involved in cell wall biosynthesis|nr:glycosyltransferase [Bacillota bacterium]
MRVLHVSSDYTLGGAGRHLLTLLRQPEFRGLDVAVACPEGGCLAREIRRMGVPFTPLEPRDRSFDIGAVSRLVALIRERRFDIVHSHASASARVAARLCAHPRIVVTRHTIGRYPPPRGARKALAAAAQTLLATRFIAVSHAVRQRLLDEGIPARMIETIHNGIDVADVRREAAVPGPAGGPRRPRLTIGSLGRLVPEKGHDILVRAFAEVSSSVPEAVLVLVGDGPERPRLERLAHEMGLSGRVVFAGYQDNALARVDSFDIFAMPSLSEGLGLALLEAMALGKPVVAARTGGIPEIVTDGENGVLVPPGDAPALARALLGLLRDPRRAERLAAAGLDTVQARFNARTMAEKTVALYRRLLAARPGVGGGG